MLTEPNHEEAGLCEMTRKVLYKDEMDSLYANDFKKINIAPKSKKITNNIKLSKATLSKNANKSNKTLFSEKFAKGHGAINEGLILPKLFMDR